MTTYEELLRIIQYYKEQTGNYPWKIIMGEDATKAFKKELEADFKGADKVINNLGVELEYWDKQ